MIVWKNAFSVRSAHSIFLVPDIKRMECNLVDRPCRMKFSIHDADGNVSGYVKNYSIPGYRRGSSRSKPQSNTAVATQNDKWDAWWRSAANQESWHLVHCVPIEVRTLCSRGSTRKQLVRCVCEDCCKASRVVYSRALVVPWVDESVYLNRARRKLR